MGKSSPNRLLKIASPRVAEDLFKRQARIPAGKQFLEAVSQPAASLIQQLCGGKDVREFGLSLATQVHTKSSALP